MNGDKTNVTSNTYAMPKTARELLAEQAAIELDPSAFNKAKSNVRLNEIMENISNNRIGFDREQFKKITVMMAKIS